jgi:acetone carboxylase gamma subunit
METDLIPHDIDSGCNAELLYMEFDKDTLLGCLLYHLNLTDEIFFPLGYHLFIVDDFRKLHFYNLNK